MLPRTERLTTSQFDRAFAHSQTVRHPLVALRAHFRDDEQENTRAAFVVPKKQAKKATQRNLIRRRLRERYRLHSLRNSEALQGCDLIFMATQQTGSASLEELDAALYDVVGRAAKKMGRGNTGGNGSRQPATEPVTEKEEVHATPSIAPLIEEENAPLLPLTALALGAIRFYQRFISPGLPPSCRFEPSCSRYTYTSIERFGVFRGTVLGAMRICKCHPWHAGGLDPVPQFFPAPRLKSQNKKKFLMRFSRSHPKDGASL